LHPAGGANPRSGALYVFKVLVNGFDGADGTGARLEAVKGAQHLMKRLFHLVKLLHEGHALEARSLTQFNQGLQLQPAEAFRVLQHDVPEGNGWIVRCAHICPHFVWDGAS
jgi:hypothetical protein